MTVAIVKAALATQLGTMNPAPVRIETNWMVAPANSDLPLVCMRQALGQQNDLGVEALGTPGLAFDAYWLDVAFLLKAATAPNLLLEHLEYAEPWPRALGVALAANMKLSLPDAFIMADEIGRLATYEIGLTTWANNSLYLTMMAKIKIKETLLTPVG